MCEQQTGPKIGLYIADLYTNYCTVYSNKTGKYQAQNSNYKLTKRKMNSYSYVLFNEVIFDNIIEHRFPTLFAVDTFCHLDQKY